MTDTYAGQKSDFVGVLKLKIEHIALPKYLET